MLSEDRKNAIVKAAIAWWREEWGCAKAASINEARKRHDDDPLEKAECALISSMDDLPLSEVLSIIGTH